MPDTFSPTAVLPLDTPHGVSLSELTVADLTLAELNEVQRFVDGPITAQHVADIKARHGRQYTATYAEVPAARYVECIRLCDEGAAFWDAEADRFEAEAAEMQADRDGMYPNNQQDRKTVHIQNVLEQRDMARHSAASKRARAAEYQAKLATLR